jgi:hypothetical protein
MAKKNINGPLPKMNEYLLAQQKAAGIRTRQRKTMGQQHSKGGYYSDEVKVIFPASIHVFILAEQNKFNKNVYRLIISVAMDISKTVVSF